MAKLLTKRQQRRLVTAILGLLLIGFLWVAERQGWISQTDIKQQPPVQEHDPGFYTVTKVVDGDTISVDIQGTIEQVRLIGVDTPETKDPRVSVQCFGQNASDYTKSLIGNQPVRLEQDSLNDDRDRYKRLLRYVYLQDGTLVNAEIIKQGYGFAYTLYPFEKLEDFRNYETTARQQNKGLWSLCEIQQDGQKKTTTPAQ